MISCLVKKTIVFQPLSSAFRFYKKMVADLLLPPKSVKGMKNLDRTKFLRTVEVPVIEISSCGKEINESIKAVKGTVLKIPKMQPVIELSSGKKGVLLNPGLVKSLKDVQVNEEALAKLGITEDNLKMEKITVSYENYKMEDILDAILGEEEEGCKSYTRIGHIVHLNIREHLLEYKNIIGEVILDKLKGVRAVVNKLNIIDNTYRNFQMEVIAGEDDMITTVSENKCLFTFDFSKVYWNSRLSTEHERLIQKFEIGSVIYDVCAGVGPFSVPAAKLRKCEVYANDLNPESVKWLLENAKKNKVKDKVEIHNLDGNVFLKTIFRENFLKRSRTGALSSHIVMNLPAMAVEFLPVFAGLFQDEQIKEDVSLPIVHVYCFVKVNDNHEQVAVQLVESKLGCSLGDNLVESFRVRNVAPSKEMMRVSFRLPKELVFGQVSPGESVEEPLSKKLKCEST